MQCIHDLEEKKRHPPPWMCCTVGNGQEANLHLTVHRRTKMDIYKRERKDAGPYLHMRIFMYRTVTGRTGHDGTHVFTAPPSSHLGLMMQLLRPGGFSLSHAWLRCHGVHGAWVTYATTSKIQRICWFSIRLKKKEPPPERPIFLRRFHLNKKGPCGAAPFSLGEIKWPNFGPGSTSHGGCSVRHSRCVTHRLSHFSFASPTWDSDIERDIETSRRTMASIRQMVCDCIVCKGRLVPKSTQCRHLAHPRLSEASPSDASESSQAVSAVAEMTVDPGLSSPSSESSAFSHREMRLHRASRAKLDKHEMFHSERSSKGPLERGCRETKATLGHFSSKLQQWLRIASELKITRSDSVKLLRATHATFIARRWKRSSNTCKLFPLTQRSLLSMVSKDNADEHVQWQLLKPCPPFVSVLGFFFIVPRPLSVTHFLFFHRFPLPFLFCFFCLFFVAHVLFDRLLMCVHVTHDESMIFTVFSTCLYSNMKCYQTAERWLQRLR